MNSTVWLALVLASAVSGCGLSRKVAIRSLVPVLDQTMEAAYQAGDAETVREAIPGNLLVLRGLSASDPGNERIRVLAVQTTFSYAMGFIEDDDPGRASTLYAEGLALGREGLERHDWFRRADGSKPLPDADALGRAGPDDVPLLFWTLANWIGWISVNLEEPAAVAQLSRVEVYLERILELHPDFFLGMPWVLSGSLLSFRPKMLGGDPEKGRARFEEAIRLSEGRMLLYHVLFARYYCRQVLDEDCFERALTEVEEAPGDLLPEYRLFNLVAKEKAHRLMEKRDELF